MNRIFWLATLLIVIMSYISSEGIVQSFRDLVFFIALTTWAPVLFAFLHSALGKNKNAFQFIFASAFIAVAGVAFYYLSLATRQVIQSGPLETSGMLFVFLPFVYIQYAFFGALFGGAVFLVMRLFGKYA
ncbi:hypothetical protein ACOJR9_02750 [Alteromonas sp. A081]|uniref:hypothetical protein n=1 Tax=Alteromonas sp. A081 TaxID=3410269 RepID=UPI003B983FB3